MTPINIGPETEQVEYKKSTGELKEGIISIASILNKHGHGELYFGVKNDGTVIGQKIGNDTQRDVSKAIRSHIKPTVYPEISVREIGDCEVVYVKFCGERQPYLAYDIPRIRVSDEDLVMDQDMYDDMLRQRDDKRKSWESQTSAYTIDDIDDDSFRIYLAKAKSAGRITFENEEKEIVLKKLDLMNGKYLLNAGAALFCNTGINELQIARFATDERLTFTDIRKYTGSIIDLADKAEKYVLDAINWRAEIKGLTREEIPEIPVAAIREAIINAFAHRVIESAQSVEVAVFKSRIEIYNYGAFPEQVSPEQFAKGNERPIRRNPLICKTLYFSRDMETFATGLKRISDYCDEAGCEFEFQKKPYGFCVVFFRQGNVNSEENTQVGTKNTQVDTQVKAKNTQVSTQVKAKNTQVDTQVKNKYKGMNLSKRELDIIEFCVLPRSKAEIAAHLNLKSVKSIKAQMDELLRLKILEMTIPDRPRSSRQRYVVRGSSDDQM